MKKFLRTLTLLALLSVPWVSQGQTVVTIGDESSTSTTYVTPFNSLWGYSFVEQIYTASEIDLAGNITSIKFYLGTANSSITHDVTVYMKNVTQSTFSEVSDYVPVTAADIVYQGQMTISGTVGWITIPLTTPFVYDGSSNLMIAMHEYTSGYSTRYFTYTSTPNSVVSFHSDSYDPDPYNLSSYSGSSYVSPNRANIQLEIAPLDGFCPRPAGFAARDITTTSATLGWSIPATFDNVSSVSVEYGPQGFTPGTGTPATVDGDSAVITELSPATVYQALAVSDCGNDGGSDTAWLTFRTKALPVVDIPYTTGFEPTDDLGWEFNNGTNGWFIDTAVHHTGSYSLYISNDNGAHNAYSHTATNSYAYREFVLPSTGDYMLSFDWKAQGESSSYDYLEAYLAPSSTDFSGTVNTTGWVNLGRMNLSTTWQHAEYVLGAEANASCFLVFRWYNDGSGGSQPPAAVDNVSVSIMPCSRPTDFEVTDATTTSITLDWTAISGESAWQISVNNDSSWVEVTSHPLTIDTLQEATFYTFYLRADCGTDSSLVVSTRGVTACTPVAQLPYVQTFDSLATGSTSNFDPCWVRGSGRGATQPYVNTTNSNKALYAYVGTDTGYAYAILPQLDATVDVTDMEMTFQMKSSSTSYNGRVIVAMLPDRTFDATTVYDTVAIVTVGGNTTYEMKNVPFINYAGTNSHVALIFTRDGAGNGVYIDSVDLHQAPACIVPYNLAITEVDTTSVTISFEGISSASFKVKITSDSLYADSATISGFTHSFYGLTPFTHYTISVAQECTEGFSEASTLSFTTPVPGVDLPYSSGFERTDDTLWYLDNTGATNKWYIGNATNNGGGRALYISNDNGTTNEYTNTSTSYAYAFKAVNCDEAGIYAVNFDWKAGGESTYDFIRVFAMPASSSFESGSSSGITSSSIPNGWQALDGGSKLNLQSTWQNRMGTFNVTTPGVYYVVFYWVNDISQGDNPPAAIDNVQIVRLTCPQPTALHLDSLHANDVTISWHSGAEETEWLVRATTGTNIGEWIPVEDSVYTFTDLTASSDYLFEVRAYCGVDDTSFISSITAHTTNLCNPVTGLAVSGITIDSAHVQWTRIAGRTYGYEYGPYGYEEGDGITGIADTNFLDLGDLEAATTYVFHIWSICDAGNGPISTITFNTKGLPITTFPYTTSFELGEDIAWEKYNGVNAWIVDTAVASTGSRSLYISNNNHANAYTVGNITMSYATRTFVVDEAAQYYIGFDWKAYGEGNYDYLRAWIAPATATFTPNQLPDSTTSPNSYVNTTPTGWIDLGGKMNLQTEWQTTEAFTDLAAGQYVLVFMWANDGSVGTNPPAAIDNVTIAPVSCHRPSALTIENVTDNTVSFHWTPDGEATSFEVTFGNRTPVIVNDDTSYTATGLDPFTRYSIGVRAICEPGDTSLYKRATVRTDCGAISTLPYVETFESYGSGSTSSIDSCWTKGTNYSTAYPYPYSTNAIQGQRSLYFYATSTYYSYVALPAFTTPVDSLMMSFKVRRYNSSDNTTKLQVGLMSDPNDINTFENIYTVDLTDATLGSIHDVEVFFNGYTGNGRYMAIFDATNSTTSYAYVDSIVVDRAPSCTRPMNINFTHVEGTSATVNVMAAADAQLVYVLRQDTTVIDSSMTASTTRTYNNLTPHTRYTVKVYTLCPDGLTAPTTSSFKTTYLGVDLPYSTGFEGNDAADWYFENGSYTNKWVAGSAARHSGNNALYISNNNGISNAYTNSSAPSYVYALKTFNVPAGEIGVRFDWRAKGESTYDYLRVFLVPGTVDITAGDLGISTTGAPTGWIALDGGKLNLADGWQNCVKVFNNQTAGVYNLVFYWCNDNSAGTQPPAAIDNVTIKPITCPAPTAFVVDTVTSDSVAFHWRRGGQESSWKVAVGDIAPVTVTDTFYSIGGLNIASEYQVRITAVCGEGDESFDLESSFITECAPFPVPYVENFDDREAITDLRCWGYANGSNSTYPTKITYLTGNHNDRLLMMYAGGYFITPEVQAALYTLELGMSYQTSGDSNYLAIGYLDSLSQPVADSIFVDTLWAYDYPVSGLGHRVYYLLDNAPATAKHVVVKSANSGTTSFDFFGFVKLAAPRTCFEPDSIEVVSATTTSATLAWTVNQGTPTGYQVEYGPRLFAQGTGTVVNTTAPTVTLNGLSNAVPYEVYVRSICGAGDTSEWSMPFEFSTECGALDIPVLYRFDEYAVVGSTYGARLPNCWAFDSASVDSANTYHTPCMYSNGGNIELYMEAPNSVVALPELNAGFDTVMLSFNMRNGSTSYALVVGTVASLDSNFGETFEALDTLRYADAGMVEEFMVLYNGTNTHIAFKNINLDGGAYADIFIDSLLIQRAPTCYPVRHLAVAGVGADSVVLDWDDVVAASSWSIEYGAGRFTPGTGTTVNVTAHPATVSGLTPNTVYSFYVTPVCSATDSGATAGPVAQRTLCSPVALPYNENFDGLTTATSPVALGMMPDCWDFVMTNSSYSTSSYYPQLYYSSSNANSGSYSLRLYGVGYTMLPPMPVNLDTLMLTFADYTSDASYGLEVGVMEGNTFVPVQTISTPTSSHRTHTVFFNNYTGNSRIIAFRNYNSTPTTGYSYHYIDDIQVDYLPACAPATNVHAVSATPTSITIDWTPLNNNATAWQVEIGAQDHNPGAATARRIIVSGHPTTVRGLDSASTYDVYVRPICSATDTGMWSAVATLSTALCDGARIASTGAPNGTSYYAPVNNYYKYTLTETIIDSAELAGMTSAITTIAYSYNYSTAMTDKTDVTIWLQPTTKKTFSSSSDIVALDTSTAVQVYSGDLNCSRGWNAFTLTTPYQWDGHSNLLVIVDDNSYDYNASSYVFNTSSCTGNKTIYYYSDSYDPDPTAPSSFSGSKSAVTWRPTMQLISCGSACVAPTTLNVAATENTVTATWNGSAVAYEVAIVAGNNFVEPENGGAIVEDTTHTFNGLAAATQYTVGVRSLCDDDATSEWVVSVITTDEHPCLMPTNVELVSNTLTSAVIDWTPAEAENDTWAIKITGAGFNLLDTITTHPYTVNGLTANTDYSVQVMTICSAENGSDFTEAMTFSTIDCQTVTGVTVSNITSSSAVVSWDAVEGSTGRYEVNYGTAGFPQGSGSMMNVTNGTTVTLTGLDDDALYDVYVRTYCAENVHSMWSTVYHFSTLENGIDDVTGANIALYPNPAHSTVTLTGIEGEATVTVVDMNGRVISETRSENGKLTLDVSGMAQGAYFVRITGEQVNAIRKLIVR